MRYLINQYWAESICVPLVRCAARPFTPWACATKRGPLEQSGAIGSAAGSLSRSREIHLESVPFGHVRSLSSLIRGPRNFSRKVVAFCMGMLFCGCRHIS